MLFRSVLRAIAGLVRPAAGRIECGETWFDDSTHVPAERRSIGFVFQEPLLVGHLPAIDNVRLWRPDVTRERCEELLAALGIEGLANRLPSQLSGGQQQRVAVARALASTPTLIVADEPTASLDDDNASAVIDVLRRHADGGGAVVIATHDRRAFEAGDRRVRLEHGRVAREPVP